MKVSELIEILNDMPKDADVVVAEIDMDEMDSIYTPTVACFSSQKVFEETQHAFMNTTLQTDVAVVLSFANLINRWNK